MKRLLLIDCYLDERGCAKNYVPASPRARWDVVRAVRETLPARHLQYDGVVISGSAASVLDEPSWLAPLEDLVRERVASGAPLLGICFGHQVLARALHGAEAVRRSPTPEFGVVRVDAPSAHPLLESFGARFECFASHTDEVVSGIPGLEILARSEHCAVQAYQVEARPAFGVQFHAEMPRAEALELVSERADRLWDRGLDPSLVAAKLVRHEARATSLLEGFLKASAVASHPSP